MSLPYFKFYPNDWLGSQNIAVMTPAEEGAYIRLLAYAWNSQTCSIPDDDTVLARISRLGEEWMNGSGNKIRLCFYKKDGKLFNKKLGKLNKHADTVSDHNRRGAEKRWGTRKAKRRTEKFAIPTLAEVTEYCKERKNQVNPEKFYAYYESNGWRVGKNPMQSWKASVITWENNNYQNRPSTPKPNLFTQPVPQYQEFT